MRVSPGRKPVTTSRAFARPPHVHRYGGGIAPFRAGRAREHIGVVPVSAPRRGCPPPSAGGRSGLRWIKAGPAVPRTLPRTIMPPIPGSHMSIASIMCLSTSDGRPPTASASRPISPAGSRPASRPCRPHDRRARSRRRHRDGAGDLREGPGGPGRRAGAGAGRLRAQRRRSPAPGVAAGGGRSRGVPDPAGARATSSCSARPATGRCGRDGRRTRRRADGGRPPGAGRAAGGRPPQGRRIVVAGRTGPRRAAR